MSLSVAWLIVLAAVLVVGLLLGALGKHVRRSRGLGEGKTVSLDRVTLASDRLGLTGRPDRLVRSGGTLFPEEWKSSRQVHDAHRAQLGVYFLLIEDQLQVRPPYGFIVCGDGTRHRIENTATLRSWVLGLVDEIRAARAAVHRPLPVDAAPAQCRSCGQRANCGQARL